MLAAAAPISAAAAAAKCRYGVLAIDGTARTNKPGYKSLMAHLWSVFMVHEVPRWRRIILHIRMSQVFG